MTALLQRITAQNNAKGCHECRYNTVNYRKFSATFRLNVIANGLLKEVETLARV